MHTLTTLATTTTTTTTTTILMHFQNQSQRFFNVSWV